MLESKILVSRENNSPDKKIFGKFNKAFISGKIASDFKYSHQAFGNTFYQTNVTVVSKDEAEDKIPIMVCRSLLTKGVTAGKFIEIAGQLRTYNKEGEYRKKYSDIYLFAKEINISEELEEMQEDINTNEIYLEGYVCMSPIFRVTPKGDLVTYIMLSVNRGKCISECIPCTVLGEQAVKANRFKVGNRIQLQGRFQRRDSFKKKRKGVQDKVNYEVFVKEIERAEK